jgi:hypothetical protein
MAKKKPTPSKPSKKKAAAAPANKKGTAPAKKPQGSPTTSTSNSKNILAIICLITIVLAGLFVITNWPQTPTAVAPAKLKVNINSTIYPEAPIEPVSVAPAEPEQPTNNPAITNTAKIAIIMDDLGISLRHGTEAINLAIPITCAIIPGEQYSTAIMDMAHNRQFEIIIHMPMEPVNYPKNNPGSLALFVNQSDDEIIATTQQLIALSPYATGVNNHMGSEFTQHCDKMDLVLGEMKKKQLFFIDSLTISGSVAYTEAKRLGVPTAKRNVFLDNDRDVDKILIQLQKLVATAQKRKHAIGICHPYPETIAALAEFSTILPQLDVEMVPVSQLLQHGIAHTNQDKNGVTTNI